MKAYCEHETLVGGKLPEEIRFGEEEALHCLEIKEREDFLEFLGHG